MGFFLLIFISTENVTIKIKTKFKAIYAIGSHFHYSQSQQQPARKSFPHQQPLVLHPPPSRLVSESVIQSIEQFPFHFHVIKHLIEDNLEMCDCRTQCRGCERQI